MGVLLGVNGALSGEYGADGNDLRMRNPVCLYLNLDMQYIQVVFGVNELN